MEGKRRNVLKGILGASVALVTAPIVYAVGRFVSHVPEVSGEGTAILKASELAPSKLIKVGSEPVIVLKEKDGDIRAFTATCTHLKCTVGYRPANNDFYCKCHRGRYDENGINIPGTRPKRPLTELTVNKDGETLTISLTPLKKNA
jgi:Rieske Fe-S protein